MPGVVDLTWSPVVSGDLARRVETVVGDIASALEDSPEKGGGRDLPANVRRLQGELLGGGGAGLALMYAQLAVATGRDDFRSRAIQLVDGCAEAMAEVPMGPSLFGGFAGLAWTVQRVDSMLIGEGEDLGEEIDGALAMVLENSPWQADYDLISGLAGMAIYALDRTHIETGRRVLELVIDRLDELSVARDGAITWKTPPEFLPEHQLKLYPDGYLNLGLAHGVPAVIAILARAYAAGVSIDKTRRLVDGAVRWVLDQRLPFADGTCFPAICADGIKPSPGRLAWCYGDPGVVMALITAARSTEDATLEETALKIARVNAEAAFDKSGVVDAGLCHGSAGLVHIFNRLYHATGDEIFAAATRRWLEKTLDLRVEGTAYAGFPSWEVIPEPRWVPSPGLVEGAAGVALALSGTVHSVEPRWDACMLMELPA